MKPLFHPAAADITVAGVLHALADPVRVQIFAGIVQANCPQSCSAYLEVSNRVLPKSTLSQHFRVLREAGLVRSERVGVEMHNTPRCDEINAQFPGLVDTIIEAHHAQLKREDALQRKAQRAARQQRAASQPRTSA